MTDNLKADFKLDFKGVNFASFKKGFAEIIEILKLNRVVLNQVAGRESEGISLALCYQVVGALGMPLGGAIFGSTFLNVLYRTPIVTALIQSVVAVIIALGSVYLLHLVAVKFFQGKGKFDHLYRVIGYVSLIQVVGIITMVPLLVSIAMIWLLVVEFVALREIYKIDNTQTVLSILVSGVLIMIVCSLLNTVLGGGLMGGVVMSGGYSFIVR